MITYGNFSSQLYCPKVLHKPNSHPMWFTPEIKHKLNQTYSLMSKNIEPIHLIACNATKISVAEAHLQSIMTIQLKHLIKLNHQLLSTLSPQIIIVKLLL